jgi:hypothetical protein
MRSRRLLQPEGSPDEAMIVRVWDLDRTRN